MLDTVSKLRRNVWMDRCRDWMDGWMDESGGREGFDREKHKEKQREG